QCHYRHDSVRREGEAALRRPQRGKVVAEAGGGGILSRWRLVLDHACATFRAMSATSYAPPLVTSSPTCSNPSRVWNRSDPGFGGFVLTSQVTSARRCSVATRKRSR